MNDEINSIKSRNKEKRNNFSFNNIPEKENSNKKTYLKKLVTRTLIAAIFLLGSVIFMKYNNETMSLYKKYVFTNSLPFNKINELYQKYLGDAIPFKTPVDNNTTPVFNEVLTYSGLKKYQDGVELSVSSSYAIPAVNSGIVVFIGEKEGYNQTVIIQGVDGVDIWYGNIETTGLKVYDYIEKGSLLGETTDQTLYLVLQKDGAYLNYEEYNQKS